MKLREPDAIMKNWPQGDRPSVKLYERGGDALSDCEVLSILLRNGHGEKSAIEQARDLLNEFGSLAAIFSAEPSAAERAGISGEQWARITATPELARRMLREKLVNGSALSSPTAVREYLRLHLQSLPHEVFVCLFLDAQNRVIEIDEMFRGTLTQTSVYPREVVKRALHHNAGAVIFAHNHPSGVAEPSHADETLTQALKQALALVDVRVLDHFIVAGGGVVSFAERGLL